MTGEMEKFPARAPEVAPQHQQLAKEVWQALGCKDPLTKKFIQVVFLAIKVFDYKQARYGTGNISRNGGMGVTIRLGDKLERIENMIGKPMDPSEPVEDSFGDVGNYGFIGLMCRYGWWPDVPAAYLNEVAKQS